MTENEELQRITAQYEKVVEQNRSLQKELQRKNQEIENLKEENECIRTAAKIANDGLKFVTAKAIGLSEENKVLKEQLDTLS